MSGTINLNHDPICHIDLYFSKLNNWKIKNENYTKCVQYIVLNPIFILNICHHNYLFKFFCVTFNWKYPNTYVLQNKLCIVTISTTRTKSSLFTKSDKEFQISLSPLIFKTQSKRCQKDINFRWLFLVFLGFLVVF